MALQITDSNLPELINSPQVTVVDLWAEWCGPCRVMGPIIDELATEFKDKAQIGKLNVDENPNATVQFNVRGIPTFLIFKNGELVDKVVGAVPKGALVDKINQYMN